jgi:hypothetical protein
VVYDGGIEEASMRKLIFIPVASLALAFAGAVSARAATIAITMDPNGTAGAHNVSIDTFDLKEGNGIALGLTGGSAQGAAGTFLFQANLNTGTLGGNSQFASGLGGAQNFTFVAGISETIKSNVNGTITFNFNPAGTNFFDIYANPTGPGANLTGNCFANEAGCGKTLVLKGTFLNDGSFSSGFVVNQCPGGPGGACTDQFDKFDSPDPYGIQTVTGNGSFQANIGNFSAINALFFPSGLPASLLFKATSQQSIPFQNVSPSQCFSADGLTGGHTGTLCTNQGGENTVGAINGLSGPNTMLQTHAGMSFIATVPEPASMTLLGFGLLAASARLRRMRNKRS